MEIIRVNNYQKMSEKACALLTDVIKTKKNPVLGLATGSTPEGLYQQLIEQYSNGELSFKNTTTFNLDEYVGLEKNDPNSYYYYMYEKLFKHIDIPTDQANLPSGVGNDLEKVCQDYEQKISQAGNVDIQVLGIGLNGHIGFNEPGTPFSSRTHIVDLDESTREANARFFNSINDVPTKAITMGINSIMNSKQIVLLVSGEKKKDAVARLVNGEISESFPASILKQHGNVVLIADEAALGNV
ncbi:glucosamine-6-phosphate deaminase [Lentibacillus sp. Marseille-P4043]|uniref:glucosamine-6-phosphate deaminase n=1 Tax=Lentibacillus sp. Marseille-P4043 TaxID=2040293 RepID=UPI000D0BDC9D|nr:glucosamine-6-phosphate deaminase [Lentibacillus sp. Marseille-P4043]